MAEFSDLASGSGGNQTSSKIPQPPRITHVIQLLEDAAIPSCVVGTRALRYFGAGREWDICILDHQLDTARAVIEKSGKYKHKDPPYPNPDSLRHTYATFKADDDGDDFSFLLAPSSDCFCDPRPEFCERSHTGVPYPQHVPFAKALLVKQNRADLADFIDAQDLSGEWGEENINFAELQAEGVEYATRMNAKFADDPQSPSRMHVGRDLRKDWMSVVESKESRIEPLKQGRYITRWRMKSRPQDPRLRHDRKGI
ncbi:hypothetical protein B0H66DRAFT_472935 [Apodospora peruviana]|uniref:Uncharacterized protein n=1 Tax=Apodospora peruviana TaxID=516989 RepID=A0AAE0M9A7_9PEZI|nr:hypothetical protein B0H66DRAFT_472935 [Apodospora peruviana]